MCGELFKSNQMNKVVGLRQRRKASIQTLRTAIWYPGYSSLNELASLVGCVNSWQSKILLLVHLAVADVKRCTIETVQATSNSRVTAKQRLEHTANNKKQASSRTTAPALINITTEP